MHIGAFESRFSAIVFDFDGVLVNSEATRHRAFQEAISPHGDDYPWPVFAERLLVYSDQDLMAVVSGELARRGNHLDVHEAVTRMKASFDRHCHDIEGAQAGLPGAADFVRAAARRVPVAVASGSNRREVVRGLEGMGIASFFSAIVTADEVARSKPHPETYVRAVEALAAAHPDAGITPARCLAFEDSTGGVASAKAAGLYVAGLLTHGVPAIVRDAHTTAGSLADTDLDAIAALAPALHNSLIRS